MSTVAIHITLEPGNGRPVSLARLDDPEIIERAAHAAVLDARRRAIRARDVDETLGRLRDEEADRLERYLGLLIPQLDKLPTLQ